MVAHWFFALKRWLRILAWATAASTSSALWAQPATVLFNPGDQFEGGRFQVFNTWRSALEQALMDAGADAVKSRF